MSIKKISELTCVFVELNNGHKLIGCVTQDDLNNVYSTTARSTNGFELCYPVDIILYQTRAPFLSTTSTVTTSSTSVINTGTTINEPQFKMHYIYWPQCQYAAPQENKVFVTFNSVSIIFEYDKENDSQLKLIYDQFS